MNAGSPDSPGVVIPPPAFYVASYVAGALVERLVPLQFRGSELLRESGAAVLLVAAMIAGGGAILRFLFVRTHIFPHKPATTLVTTGVYRVTRNPMYVALTLVHAGIALLFDHVWPLATLPIAMIVIDRHVISKEEAYLSRRFGAVYEDYRSRVRRWI